MRERRGWRERDQAVSDLVGTFLLVGMVVVAGSGVMLMVVTTLSAPTIPHGSFSMASASIGDDSAGVIYRNGELIPLDSLLVTLQRNGSAPALVPRGNWTAPESLHLRAGDRLDVMIQPVISANETLRLRLFRTDLNVMLTEVATHVGAAGAVLGTPVVTVQATPPSLPADGSTVTRLTVHASHPAGGLAIARVEAAIANASQQAGGPPFVLPLLDDGRVGDEVGGDGVWSAFYTLPVGTPKGEYSVEFRVIDASGRATASANLTLEATAVPLSSGVNHRAPTSSNMTQFLVRNWTYDRLHPERLTDDFAMMRITGGGESWTGRIRFQEVSGVAYAIEYRAWTQTNETVYVPTAANARLALDGMTLNLLDPTGGGEWARLSGDSDPAALFANAGVQVAPLFRYFIGQDQATGNPETSLDTGLLDIEVVLG